MQEIIKDAKKPIELVTANGKITVDKQAHTTVGPLHEEITPYVLDNTPAVISVGRRCTNEGYDFIWRSGKLPYFKTPDGHKIEFDLEHYVPQLHEYQEQSQAMAAKPSQLAYKFRANDTTHHIR